MDISPVTRKEHFLARAAGDEDALELQPVTREEHLLQNIIDAIEQGGGGGSGTDSNAVHYTADTGKTDSEKAQALANIGAVAKQQGEIVSPVILGGSSDDGVMLSGSYINNVPVLDVTGSIGDEKVRITSVADPVSGYDAANKRYADGYVETVSGTTATIALAAHNTIYECGELTSLTITAIPATGSFVITFDSGSTPTTTDFPANMKFPSAFAAEANTHYEINVRNGYAVAVGWAVSA